MPPAQDVPHPHSVHLSPDNRFLLVNDLGSDRISVFPVDPATARLGPPALFSNNRPGSGPRHIAFHPNGRWLYSINELDSTIDRFLWTTTSSRTDAPGPAGQHRRARQNHRPQLPRRQKHRRRGRHLARRQLPLRQQPRRGLAGRLQHRSRRRRAHPRAAHLLRRQDPAPLHPRPLRTLAPLRQSGLRLHHHLPPRLCLRPHRRPHPDHPPRLPHVLPSSRSTSGLGAPIFATASSSLKMIAASAGSPVP